MNVITIQKPHFCTKMPIWAPKYSEKYKTKYGDYTALLHKEKADHATPVIIIEFTRAKHLQGQRFCITRKYAQEHEVGSNGTAPMYEIPMSHFDTWQTAAEVRDLAFGAFSD